MAALKAHLNFTRKLKAFVDYEYYMNDFHKKLQQDDQSSTLKHMTESNKARNPLVEIFHFYF